MAKRTTIPLLASYYDKNTARDASNIRLVNMYLEEVPNFTGSQLTIAIGTPGYALWKDLSGDTVRGMLVHKDYMYVVVDDSVYKVDTNKTSTLIGTLNNLSGDVSIAAINDEICFADGNGAWSYIPSTGDWAAISDVDLPANASIVLGISGYFLFLKPDSQIVYVSDLNDGRSISATSFFSAEYYPDNLVSGITMDNLVYLFGEESTEIFYVSGGQTVPFDRYGSGAIPYGVQGAMTPKLIQGSVYWLAKAKEGVVGVIQSNGNGTSIISTRDLVEKINSYDNIDDVFSWVDYHNGHTFYNLTFPNAELYTRGRTWSYDTTTNVWFERQSYNINGQLTATQDRHTASASCQLNKEQLIGDFQSGKIYLISSELYDEDGTAIQREIISPHIVVDDNFLSMYNLEIDVQGGVGLQGSGQGSAPEIMMSCSKDRGHTWSSEITRPIGNIGDYRTKVRWASLGGGYSFTIKLRMSDPVNWVVLKASAQIEVTQGT